MEHVGFTPKNCGRLFAQEEDKSVILRLTTELLPEEEASEFAKYYHLGACEASEEAQRMLKPGMELESKNAFLPNEVKERMMHPGYDKNENGFCVMENGVVYAALLTEQPGVNDETMGYFMKNFTTEPGDLFYKIWCPGTHYRLYPDLSLEDMGWGPLEVRTTGFFPQQALGIFDDPAGSDPNCIAVMGINMEVVPLGAPEGTEPLRIMEVNYERQTGEGR
ncbi:MAG: hypothetical protein LIO86_11560 [Lachnospiraceae bacterium]|nr:hypothetical protein [Lachnospiraceae bacterium]